jgi:hypothetical protein
VVPAETVVARSTPKLLSAENTSALTLTPPPPDMPVVIESSRETEMLNVIGPGPVTFLVGLPIHLLGTGEDTLIESLGAQACETGGLASASVAGITTTQALSRIKLASAVFVAHVHYSLSV